MGQNNEKFNIVVVSLNDKFCKNIACLLAESLDMFYADCHELVVYDLINPKEVLLKCGLEYLKKREKNVFENCSQYRNTVFSISFDYLKDNISLFENSIIIFVDLPILKITKTINKIEYDNRTKYLKSISHITIKSEKCIVKKVVNMILEKLGEMYENS